MSVYPTTTQRHASSCDGLKTKVDVSPRMRHGCERITHHKTSQCLSDYGDGVLAPQHAGLEERQPRNHTEDKDLWIHTSVNPGSLGRDLSRNRASCSTTSRSSTPTSASGTSRLCRTWRVVSRADTVAVMTHATSAGRYEHDFVGASVGMFSVRKPRHREPRTSEPRLGRCRQLKSNVNFKILGIVEFGRYTQWGSSVSSLLPW